MYPPKYARCYALLGLPSLSQGLLLEPATLQQNLLDTYDYVIVGAGPAGLVVANRLTQDASINVLVLEAGPMDSREAGIMFPSNIGTEVGSKYDWNITTVAQTSLNGVARSVPQGHAVGGGTVLNGMIWTRGTRADYDAWKTFGNAGWGWDDMVPYFQRVEAFTNNMASGEGHEVVLTPDSSIYGQSGQVEVAYPEYLYSQYNNFIEGNIALGLDLANDTSGGTNVGVTIPPTSISATNQSRCDARAAYLDSAIDRTNLHIAPEQRVTRLLLNQGDGSADPVAEGVEFVSATDSSQVLSISATREVILAAGAIWTPTLLQVSGIGPSAVLKGLGIDTIVDLSGVGNNLQDHGMVDGEYAYSSADLFSTASLQGATLRAATEEYYNSRKGPLTATLIEAIAYLPLSSLSDSSETLISQLSSADPNTYLPFDYPDDVRTGYAAQYAANIQLLSSSTEGAIELMPHSTGRIQVTARRPFSRGTVRPVSNSLLDGVQVDPRYCSNPFDRDVVVMGLEWNSRLITTAPMQELAPQPNATFASGDESQLADIVNNGIGTEFHPCGTTAMLPREIGGVVDTALSVYGVQNLRSVGSASIPMIPSAHIQAIVYALSEKAADAIIAAQSDGTTTSSNALVADSILDDTIATSVTAVIAAVTDATEAVSPTTAAGDSSTAIVTGTIDSITTVAGDSSTTIATSTIDSTATIADAEATGLSKVVDPAVVAVGKPTDSSGNSVGSGAGNPKSKCCSKPG